MRKVTWLAILAICFSFSSLCQNGACKESFKKIQIDENLLCTFISFTPDGQYAIYIKKTGTGHNIIKYDISKKTKTLLNKESKKPSFIFKGCHYWTSNDYVCWLDEGRIYAFNLKADKEILVSSKTGSPTSISLASHYLFWTDGIPGENSHACLYYKDLKTSESPKCIYEIKNRNYRDFFCFAFESYDNTYYAFHDFNGDKSKIMLFDTNEKKLRTLADTNNIEYFLSAQGKYVFYAEYAKPDPPPYFDLEPVVESGKIKKVDVKTGKVSDVLAFDKGNKALFFSLNRHEKYNAVITVYDYPNQVNHIYLHNLATGKTEKLFDSPTKESIFVMSLSGMNLVCTKYKTSLDVHLYNIKTKTSVAVAMITHFLNTAQDLRAITSFMWKAAGLQAISSYFMQTRL
jgi:Tol biopolymer transport system component